MIEIRDLRKFYGDFEALKGVSFSVAQGEILGFLGPNGAGKTTCMKILTGFIAATGGSVVIDGVDLDDDPIDVEHIVELTRLIPNFQCVLDPVEQNFPIG